MEKGGFYYEWILWIIFFIFLWFSFDGILWFRRRPTGQVPRRLLLVSLRPFQRALCIAWLIGRVHLLQGHLLGRVRGSWDPFCILGGHLAGFLRRFSLNRWRRNIAPQKSPRWTASAPWAAGLLDAPRTPALTITIQDYLAQSYWHYRRSGLVAFYNNTIAEKKEEIFKRS